MNVKIYKPSRNAMQSGRANEPWVLECESNTANDAEPLMGWTSSEDTATQVSLTFDSKENALAFAEKKGWNATVMQENTRRIKPKNYNDNFK